MMVSSKIPPYIYYNKMDVTYIFLLKSAYLCHHALLNMARFLSVPNRKSPAISKGFDFNPLSE